MRLAFTACALVILSIVMLAAAQPPGTMIHGFRHGFSPVRTTVPPGAQVVFLNLDSDPHTLTFDDGSREVRVNATTNDTEGYSNVTFLAPTAPGVYPFHCEIHAAQGMRGILIVKVGFPGYVPATDKAVPMSAPAATLASGIVAALAQRTRRAR